MAKAITLQTSLRGWRGPIPLGGRIPHVRRYSLIPSVLELGIPLGGWERASSKNHPYVSILNEAKAEDAKLQ